MIGEIRFDDITGSNNPGHIIIGMNSALRDVRGIGRRFVGSANTTQPIDLGSVLSFKFDARRNLHMIICHHLGEGGWHEADKYVRFGLDHLWQNEAPGQRFSVVQIGAGRIGRRDGANHQAIRTAIDESHLTADLYVSPNMGSQQVAARAPAELIAFRAWHPTLGEERLAS